MKETKVYVDELPKCIFCPMLVNLSNIGESEELMCCLNRTAYCNDYSDPEKIERNFKLACPLQSIKTHDRELVKEVCEKIKTFVRENTYICGGNATREDLITSSSYNQALRDVLGFMQTLQKEIEK